MNIQRLSETYSVGGQISEQDFATLAQAGYTQVICNRPDSEVEAHFHAKQMRVLAEANGLDFAYNPIAHTGMTIKNIESQRALLSQASGPVFAYCRSGRRSTMCWSFAMAGQVPTDIILSATANAGYRFEGLRDQLEAMAG
ncbi:MAG: TIGR01244 family phosphatase [Alphaproteobacteria bacterium]|nr:TIGR01244 family phosphatase [Alphaproteobacteria bacterium]